MVGEANIRFFLGWLTISPKRIDRRLLAQLHPGALWLLGRFGRRLLCTLFCLRNCFATAGERQSEAQCRRNGEPATTGRKPIGHRHHLLQSCYEERLPARPCRIQQLPVSRGRITSGRPGFHHQDAALVPPRLE